jgi:hypothetical protein
MKYRDRFLSAALKLAKANGADLTFVRGEKKFLLTVDALIEEMEPQRLDARPPHTERIPAHD